MIIRWGKDEDEMEENEDEDKKEVDTLKKDEKRTEN